jgi:hypothetical protein
VALLEAAVELLESLEHLDCGADRADGIVLVHGRHPEDGDDRVADVLLERAAPRSNHLGHCLEVRAQQRTQPLGIEPLTQPSRADHVGEENRCNFALLPQLGPPHCTANSGQRLRRRFLHRRLRRRFGCELQRRVLIQYLTLELLERRARLDPDLVDERLPPALEDLQRVRLASEAIEGQHQLGAGALTERRSGDERLQLGDELVVAAERQIGVEPIVERT